MCESTVSEPAAGTWGRGTAILEDSLMRWALSMPPLNPSCPEEPEDNKNAQEPHEKAKDTVSFFLGEPEKGIPGRHFSGLRCLCDHLPLFFVFTHRGYSRWALLKQNAGRSPTDFPWILLIHVERFCQGGIGDTVIFPNHHERCAHKKSRVFPPCFFRTLYLCPRSIEFLRDHARGHISIHIT